MTGGTLLGLTLFSMGWMFFILGAGINFAAWRRYRKAPTGTRYGGIPLLPGMIGSLAAFFSVGALLKGGWHVHWPWLWILLPLVLDVGCLGRYLLALVGLGGGARRRT